MKITWTMRKKVKTTITEVIFSRVRNREISRPYPIFTFGDSNAVNFNMGYRKLPIITPLATYDPPPIYRPIYP